MAHPRLLKPFQQGHPLGFAQIIRSHTSCRVGCAHHSTIVCGGHSPPYIICAKRTPCPFLTHSTRLHNLDTQSTGELVRVEEHAAENGEAAGFEQCLGGGRFGGSGLAAKGDLERAGHLRDGIGDGVGASCGRRLVNDPLREVVALPQQEVVVEQGQ